MLKQITAHILFYNYRKGAADCTEGIRAVIHFEAVHADRLISKKKPL